MVVVSRPIIALISSKNTQKHHYIEFWSLCLFLLITGEFWVESTIFLFYCVSQSLLYLSVKFHQNRTSFDFGLFHCARVTVRFSLELYKRKSAHISRTDKATESRLTSNEASFRDAHHDTNLNFLPLSVRVLWAFEKWESFNMGKGAEKKDFFDQNFFDPKLVFFVPSLFPQGFFSHLFSFCFLITLCFSLWVKRLIRPYQFQKRNFKDDKINTW